jgi:hypothetical protein
VTDPLDAFPAFAERVRSRLEAGRAYEATNPAVERRTLDLIREIQEELEDVCGWSCALWARLEALRTRAAVVDAPPAPAGRMVGAEREG